MERIADLTWLKHLYGARRVDSFSYRSYRAEAVEVPHESEARRDSFLFRLILFDKSSLDPVLCLNAEADILGEYILSLQTGHEHRFLSRFEGEPGYAEFKSLALAELDALLGEDHPDGGFSREGRGDIELYSGNGPS